MEMNEKIVRDLKRKLEIELHKREAEVIDYWKKEVETLYRKKYESFASMQVEVKGLMERMSNRIAILQRTIKER